MTKALLCTAILFCAKALCAQQPATPSDSSFHVSYLPYINLVGEKSNRDVLNLPEIVGTQVFAGKKNSLVVLDNLNMITVNNNMRQMLAKVPGIHIWESDGSGIQIGIAARGLSPNRSWEFNVRQNGADIAADPIGYPEAYYNPQMQAVQRIQIVRGSGSLQYGSQFGGMVNYIMRDGSQFKKPFQFETQQTVGSFGLLNTFNAIGGTHKKLNYYVFIDHREAKGYRDNSAYNTNTGFASLTYHLHRNLRLSLDYSHFRMQSQQPGGLTETQFAKDPTQSFRSRNWLETPWNVANLKADWTINENNRFHAKIFGVFGDRSSVGYIRPITTPDTLNTATLQYNNREIAVDMYRNVGMELGYLHEYMLGKRHHTLSAGVRLFNGHTYRKTKGKGSTGSDADFNPAGDFPGYLSFGTKNMALYAENIFRVGKHLLIIPGLRQEFISNTAEGRSNIDGNGNDVRMPGRSKSRSFLLAGIGAEYHLNKNLELYTNIAQGYRAALFSDLTTSATTDVIDPNLKDATGYNSDLGLRGTIRKYIYLDASIYYLQYNNRIGQISKKDANNNIYNYRTNVGNSSSKGAEVLLDLDPVMLISPNSKIGSFPIFVSYTYNDSRYSTFYSTTVVAGNVQEVPYKNKHVENAPQNILRAGISYKYKGLMVTYQFSHTDKSYSDANNTETPSANGQTGLLPAYDIMDLSATYKFKKNYNVKLSMNNLADAHYFTRRSGGYPGPGLLPSDGRSVLVSFGASF